MVDPPSRPVNGNLLLLLIDGEHHAVIGDQDQYFLAVVDDYERGGVPLLILGGAGAIRVHLISETDFQVARDSRMKQLPDRTALEKIQSRRTRAGSVRLARHAGKRQAEIAVIVITASADPNTNGSYGLTL